MNKVILIGRITKQPETQITQDNKSYCRFSLAVDRGVKSANGDRQTDFINCIAWEQRADFLSKYVDKGYRLAVEGRIQTGTYTDQQGNNRTTFDVVVDKVENLEPKREEQQEHTMQEVGAEFKVRDNDFEVSPDDLPF